ncbi:MAG: amidohydrolase [Myxococcota bacterium]
MQVEIHPDTPERHDEREKILAMIDAGAEEAIGLARWMGDHPELALEERQTHARYVSYLGARDFKVERGQAGMETAFVASWGDESAPLCAALLAEMDALPEIGHACGHNLSGPASLLAASALARSLEPSAARILVVGCPAEEIGVGKKRLVEADTFAPADVALMAHASDMRRAHRLFLGNRKYEFVYHGTASHAAAYPHEGRNALDGLIALFVGLGLVRQQLHPSVRVHGIISDGGQAPNVIPERAAARIWVRALEDARLEEAVDRVLECARGAAQQTRTRLEIVQERGGSPPMRPNLPLADTYRRQLDRLGLAETTHAPGECIGSSDITHISRVVPTIHPNFPIGDDLQLHTRAFAEATRSERGEQGLLEAARALALTVHEMAREPGLRRAVAEADRATR